MRQEVEKGSGSALASSPSEGDPRQALGAQARATGIPVGFDKMAST